MRDPGISLAKTVDIFKIETVAFLFFSLSLFWGWGWEGFPTLTHTQSREKKVIRVCGTRSAGKKLTAALSLRSSGKKAFRTGSCSAAQKSVF
jgi:hypothetical protein